MSLKFSKVGYEVFEGDYFHFGSAMHIIPDAFTLQRHFFSDQHLRNISNKMTMSKNERALEVVMKAAKDGNI